MYAQYISKENGSFAAAGKFLKKSMLICLWKSLCPFLSLILTWKVGFPPFHFENLILPFGFPCLKFFYQVPPPSFWNFQNLGSPPFERGGNILFSCRFQSSKTQKLSQNKCWLWCQYRSNQRVSLNAKITKASLGVFQVDCQSPLISVGETMIESTRGKLLFKFHDLVCKNYG